MKGGVIFLAMRSSQLMGEKKEWYLSSSCRAEEVRDDQADGNSGRLTTIVLCLKGLVSTYKVVLHSQPLGAVLLQQPLQQLSAGVGHVGFEHGILLQDVVVHLCCVATVERRLQRKSARGEFSLILSVNTAKVKFSGVTHESVEHLVEHGAQTPPVHGAVVRLLLQNLRGQILSGDK